MRRPPITWNGLVYYGEAVGFVAAWAIGLLVAAQYARAPEAAPTWDQIASVEELLPGAEAVVD